MSDETKPEQDPKTKKRGKKKLELHKETVQELTDEQLEGVAGGALKTGGGHCKDQSLFPACNLSANADQCNLTPKCDSSVCFTYTCG